MASSLVACQHKGTLLQVGRLGVHAVHSLHRSHVVCFATCTYVHAQNSAVLVALTWALVADVGRFGRVGTDYVIASRKQLTM